MAVGASDLAFLDICGYVRPCSCLADERRDVRGLSATVVEVQDKRISHSAIDTRMRVEIFDDARLRHRSDLRRIAMYPSRVGDLLRTYQARVTSRWHARQMCCRVLLTRDR